jgi:hypothetical protein
VVAHAKEHHEVLQVGEAVRRLRVDRALLLEKAERRTWRLHPRKESPEAGHALNHGGVLSGRQVPVELLLHRFAVVRDCLLDALGRYDDRAWVRRPACRPYRPHIRGRRASARSPST